MKKFFVLAFSIALLVAPLSSVQAAEPDCGYPPGWGGGGRPYDCTPIPQI